MVKSVRTAILAVVALLSVISVVSCSNESEPKILTAEAIDGRINNIGEISLENEWLIEEIFVDYTNLPESEKALVTNYEKLDEARNAVTKLYHTEEKDGVRFDRSKIQIGTYYMTNAGEERVQWLKDAGINFICMPNTSTEALDCYEKYGVGAFVRIKPYWCGGFSTTVEEISVDGVYNSFANSFVDHPAIWGIDITDESSAEYFSLLGSLTEEAKVLFPNQVIYLNLFPIYASSEQLGTDTYEEHIQTYVDEVDTDYISFDFYNIDKINQKKMKANYFLMRHVENLRIVADACRENDRDMWAILQAGSGSLGKDIDFLTVKQLNSQLYSSLAFGAQVINWTCWENCWFDVDSNMINSAGERTPVYYAVQEVNACIKTLSPVYMKYKNTDTAFVGNTEHLSSERYVINNNNMNFFETDGNVFEQDMFQNIQVSSEITTPTILAGSFVKRSGKGEAILFTNLTAFFGEDDVWSEDAASDVATISFTLRDKKLRVVIYYPDMSYVMEPDSDGVYSFSLENTEGVFITAEPVA